MSKNDALYTLVVEVNGKLDRIINLMTVLTDTMTEDIYLRAREAGPEIYDAKNFDEDF